MFISKIVKTHLHDEKISIGKIDYHLKILGKYLNGSCGTFAVEGRLLVTVFTAKQKNLGMGAAYIEKKG